MGEVPGESPKSSKESVFQQAKGALRALAEEIDLRAGELPETKADKVPERPKTKAELMETIKITRGEERENAISGVITKENIHEFQKVKTTINGHNVVFSITKDCLQLDGIGRIPMTPRIAQFIAQKFNCMLPTKEMVDAVLKYSDFKHVAMPTLAPGNNMDSYGYYVEHEAAINAAGVTPGSAIIGPKKIIIIGPELKNNPDKLLLHGGLKPGGTALWQNNTLAHNPDYVDYSHGVMLVGRDIEVNGVAMDVMSAVQMYPDLFGKDFNPFDFYRSEKPVKQTVETVVSESPTVYIKPVPVSLPKEVFAFGALPPQPITLDANLVLPHIPVAASEPPPVWLNQPPPVEKKADFSLPSALSAVSAVAALVTKIATHKESRESRPIDGNTIFAGDSNIAGMGKNGPEVHGKTKILAEVSRRSGWLLGEMRKLKPDEIREFKNFVCLIGTNDIGDATSAESIFRNIQEICMIAKNNGLKVYLCTVPPFQGWGNYASRYDSINTKRIKLNKLIMDHGESGGTSSPDKIIRLHRLVSGDDAKLYEEYDRGDHLHLQKLEKLLQKEVVSENTA